MRKDGDKGDEYDWSTLRWGPSGDWGVDELEAALEDDLAGYVEGKVGVSVGDDGALNALIYDNVRVDVVRRLAVRGVIVPGRRWGADAVSLMERHPEAHVEAYVECRYDDEGWYAAVRAIRIFQREPTREDVAAGLDLLSTFLAMTPGGEKRSQSCSSHWFEDLFDVGAYDWRGVTRDELSVAHEMPIPTLKETRRRVN